MGRLLTREEAAATAEQLRGENKKIALANGAFDILHVGHIRYLQAAKECADVLFVAVNSDASVHANKGPGRPTMVDTERAEILCALEAVDYVLIFDELTAEETIRAIQPDFHCKGTDYTEENVPEAELVRSLGGEVRIVGDPKDHDSSKIIAALREFEDSPD